MSDDIFESVERKQDKMDVALASSLKILIGYVKEITEFNNSELKAISLIQTDKYLKKMLEYYVKNKKHLKRRHSKEIMKALENVSGNIHSNNFFKKLMKFKFGSNNNSGF